MLSFLVSGFDRVRRWIDFLSIQIGWADPTSENSKISSDRCSRVHSFSITGDSELLDLINIQSSNQPEPDSSNVYELSEKGDQATSELTGDASCNKPLVFVARRRVDASDTIPILFSSSNIEQVVFLQCSIDDDDALRISKALAKANGCANLKSLVLLKNLISCNGTRLLATGLLIHGGVQRLDLSDNRCGDNGAEHLAFLVSQSKALHVLRLRGNGIQSRGAMALASALIQSRVTSLCMSPSSLQELDLACNEIGDCGADAFAAVLRLNGTLRSLDISDNSITIAGARRLSSAMEGNRTLDRLVVRAVARGREEQAELTALRQRHTCGPAGTRYVHPCRSLIFFANSNDIS
jgi:hypothetical protein